jgi:hypothetical protein
MISIWSEDTKIATMNRQVEAGFIRLEGIPEDSCLRFAKRMIATWSIVPFAHVLVYPMRIPVAIQIHTFGVQPLAEVPLFDYSSGNWVCVGKDEQL